MLWTLHLAYQNYYPQCKKPLENLLLHLWESPFCNSFSSRVCMERKTKKKTENKQAKQQPKKANQPTNPTLQKNPNQTSKTTKSVILLLLGCSEIWDSSIYNHLSDDFTIQHTCSRNETKPYKLRLDFLYIFKLCCNAEVRMKSMFSQWVKKRQKPTKLKVWWCGFFPLS